MVPTSKHRLSAQQKDMLARLRAGPKLAGVWDFSGSRVPAQLIAKGLVETCDHPTVKDHGYPAKAYTLTEAGRTAANESSAEAQPK